MNKHFSNSFFQWCAQKHEIQVMHLAPPESFFNCCVLLVCCFWFVLMFLHLEGPVEIVLLEWSDTNEPTRRPEMAFPNTQVVSDLPSSLLDHHEDQLVTSPPGRPVMVRDSCEHTPSIAFRHLPPNSARTGYPTNYFSISANLSIDKRFGY